MVVALPASRRLRCFDAVYNDWIADTYCDDGAYIPFEHGYEARPKAPSSSTATPSTATAATAPVVTAAAAAVAAVVAAAAATVRLSSSWPPPSTPAVPEPLRPHGFP